MHESNQEKTAFMTDKDLYCYRVMPFGLKNAGATYQRLVNRMFHEHIGWNMEVYVDNMLVKMIQGKDHVANLSKAFNMLKRYGMKLNPSKCAFRVALGKFLGCIVYRREIEANPKMIKAILEMQAPQNIKQLQQLTGKIVVLNRFISWSTDKCLSFFKILKKVFSWNLECKKAFHELKAYLVSPSLISQPMGGEPLYLYLVESPSAVSSALI